MAGNGDRWARWSGRLALAAWLVLPLATGATFGDALDGVDAAVRWVVAVGLYAGWAAGLLALLVPRALGLTVIRIAGPAALVAAGWAVVAGGTPNGADVAALASAALAAATALAGVTADALVDGSSYGAERRFALRTPSVVLFGPVQAAWIGVVAGTTAGPLLLATGNWVLGAVLTVVGGAVALVGARALHQLSRRWIVFVPAGVVVHDPLATTDPILFPRRTVEDLAPARVGPGEDMTVDLTGGAPGLVLELTLRQPLDITVRVRDRPPSTATARRVRFTPIRAGAVLAEAAARRLSGGGRS
jgi:hypothetical protein